MFSYLSAASSTSVQQSGNMHRSSLSSIIWILDTFEILPSKQKWKSNWTAHSWAIWYMKGGILLQEDLEQQWHQNAKEETQEHNPNHWWLQLTADDHIALPSLWWMESFKHFGKQRACCWFAAVHKYIHQACYSIFQYNHETTVF